MIRIQIDKRDFSKYEWDNKVIQQIERSITYNIELKINNETKNVSLTGEYLITGETPDFYEAQERSIKLTGDELKFDVTEIPMDYVLNGYDNVLEDNLDDCEMIYGDKWELVKEEKIINMKYYLTNLPPASEIGFGAKINMNIEKVYDGVNMDSNMLDKAINLLDWKNFDWNRGSIKDYDEAITSMGVIL